MGELLLFIIIAAALGGRRRNGAGVASLPTGGRPRPTPAVPAPAVPRPPGDPRGVCAFDAAFFPTVGSVKQRFAELGYAVPDRPTMNDLGPDGQLGGGDDLPNDAVRQFQVEYNVVSAKGLLGPMGGGLAMDGFVGPCTLSAIQNVYLFFPPDLFRDAVSLA